MGPSSLKFIFASDIYNAGNYHPVACRIYREVCIVILNINFYVLNMFLPRCDILRLFWLYLTVNYYTVQYMTKSYVHLCFHSAAVQNIIDNSI